MSELLVRIPIILLALTIHELAHGFVAYRLGDHTAKRMGRLSFNPLAHLDFLGTAMLLFGPFGWAKPVPVNPNNLSNPSKDMVWISLAGPLSNMILGFIFALIYKEFYAVIDSAYIKKLLELGILINIGLSFFNLLPFPPLDGFHIITGFLSEDNTKKYTHIMKIVPKAFLVLIVADWIFKFNAIGFLLGPIWKPYTQLMLNIYGLV